MTAVRPEWQVKAVRAAVLHLDAQQRRAEKLQAAIQRLQLKRMQQAGAVGDARVALARLLEGGGAVSMRVGDDVVTVSADARGLPVLSRSAVLAAS